MKKYIFHIQIAQRQIKFNKLFPFPNNVLNKYISEQVFNIEHTLKLETTYYQFICFVPRKTRGPFHVY